MTDIRNCTPRLPAAISETRTHRHSWHTNPAAKTAGICVNNSGQQAELRQAVASRDGACQTNKAFVAPSGRAKHCHCPSAVRKPKQPARTTGSGGSQCGKRSVRHLEPSPSGARGRNEQTR
uniref:Uncharacterized protein n=1 Tax=Ixodes ricinus TaxID=34613 RepID=A0A131Y5F6_IXORI